MRRSFPLVSYLACLLVCGLGSLASSCKGASFLSASEIPAGWSFSKDASQMLARSYDGTPWLTLLLHTTGQDRHLFTAPLPRPSPSPLSLLLPPLQDPLPPLSPLPDLDGSPASKPSSSNPLGFRFSFRSSRALSLQIRLRCKKRPSLSLLWTSPLVLPRSPRLWKEIHLSWTDFKPLSPSPASHFKDLLPSFEVWERTAQNPRQTATVSLSHPTLFSKATLPPPSPRP